MSLLTQYGERNKSTTSGLCVRYACTAQYGVFVFTRYATKSYAFVGMDYATAKTCAAAKRVQYLRKHNRVTVKLVTNEETGISTPISVNSPVYEALCSIELTHGDGDSWDVEIQVNETEQRASSSADTSPDVLFEAENAWAYDEVAASGSEITISAASGTVGGTTIETTLSSTVEGFNAKTSILSVSFGDSSGTYTCKSAVRKAVGVYDVTWTGSLTLTSAETIVMASFGASTSNTFNFVPATAEA